MTDVVTKQNLKPHTESAEHVLELVSSNHHGLSLAEAKKRLQQYGLNTLPKLEQAGLLKVFIHQFSSPLIYVLLAAALYRYLSRSGLMPDLFLQYY